MDDNLKEAIGHLKNMLAYTFDVKYITRQGHCADVHDKYHREKQAAIDFLRSMEAK